MDITTSLLVLLVSGGIQCIYLLLFTLAFARYTRKKIKGENPVSVIVAAKNEMANLPDLLEQLKAQDHPNFEIVIVNDRSNDGTYDFLMAQKKAVSNLTVVNVEHKPETMDGKKYALTLGIKAAKNEHLVFTDGDCQIPNSSWLSAFTAFNSKSNAQLNLGVSLFSKSKGLLGSFIQFESIWTCIQYIGLALLGMPYMGVGRNLGYTKSLFLNAKGFNSIMGITGGDDDLFVNMHANRKNTAVTLGKDTLTYSTPKKSWSTFFRQKIRHVSVGRHYKFKHRIVLGVLSLSHFIYYLALITYALVSNDYILLGALFFTRTLFLYLAFIIAGKKIGSPIPIWGLLFLDFIYVFYYLSVGIKALFTKKVRWI